MKQATQQLLVQEHGWSEPGWNDSAPFAGASISCKLLRLVDFELTKREPHHMFRQVAGVEMSGTAYDSPACDQRTFGDSLGVELCSSAFQGLNVN